MPSYDSATISSPPLVSVAMTAFNSQRWLGRALDSVLLQQTSFPIEIVISDDCSTDDTVAVARAYQLQHPHLIRIAARSKNVGMQRNFYETFETCTGKYIAWLDADDYWTDPEKLAIQVQVLECDASISACGHFVRWTTQDGEIIRKKYPSISAGRYGIEKIIRENFVPSVSMMFRNGIQRDLPSWYFDLTGLADWPILVLGALTGDIVLLDRIMADYFQTPGSAYMSETALRREAIDLEFRQQLERMLPSRLHRHARASRGKQYEVIAYLLRQQGDFGAARKTAFKAFRAPDLMDNCGSKCKALLTAILLEAKWIARRRGK